MKIPFSQPTIVGTENKSIDLCLKENAFSGGGKFSELCKSEIKRILNSQACEVFMTPSCTQSLEAAVIILGLKPGDEVIMPSFTFVTTATSFSNMGIKIKFVDIREDTLNIDENKIEEAITSKTRAIVPVHYAGVSCEMNKINEIAKKYNLFVIEDAAQGMFSFYENRHVGTMGDISAFSYHDTKNIHCGEGGSLIVNNSKFFDLSNTAIEKGTNRKKFLEGRVEKYTWVSPGSSFALSNLSSSFLIEQLKNINDITRRRLDLWNAYVENLIFSTSFDVPKIPLNCQHNGHIFYIKLKEKKERLKLMKFLKSRGISTTFHFVPLHSSPAGKQFGDFVGADVNTTRESQRILRLPIYDAMKKNEVEYVCENLREFFND